MEKETPKKFVLLCIDNEINRYKEIRKINVGLGIIRTREQHAIEVLQEFRHNIEHNL